MQQPVVCEASGVERWMWPGHAGLSKPWDEFWALAKGQENWPLWNFKQGFKKFFFSV